MDSFLVVLFDQNHFCCFQFFLSLTSLLLLLLLLLLFVCQNGETAVKMADNVDVIELLLKHGANINDKDNVCSQALYFIAGLSLFSYCGLIIIVFCFSLEILSWWELFLTIHGEVIELLLKAGADVNIKNKVSVHVVVVFAILNFLVFFSLLPLFCVSVDSFHILCFMCFMFCWLSVSSDCVDYECGSDDHVFAFSYPQLDFSASASSPSSSIFYASMWVYGWRQTSLSSNRKKLTVSQI